jgi:1-acyl-sn-glycerol-3-phosphate acyltransferase
MMFVALWRLVRVGLQLIAGLWLCGWQFPRLSESERQHRIQLWALGVLRALGMELQVKGQPALSGPLLLVANHISWADIAILHAARHCRFISKDAISRWPVIGKLARASGTLFITRESRRDALRVVHQMVDCLRAGEVLAVFPEGTTGDGHALLPFHANLLQAAITANVPIQPIALRFVDGKTGETSFSPSYKGRDTLMQSLWRTLCTPNLKAIIEFGTPEYAQGRDRRAWATDLQQKIETMRG